MREDLGERNAFVFVSEDLAECFAAEVANRVLGPVDEVGKGEVVQRPGDVAGRDFAVGAPPLQPGSVRPQAAFLDRADHLLISRYVAPLACLMDEADASRAWRANPFRPT